MAVQFDRSHLPIQFEMCSFSCISHHFIFWFAKSFWLHILKCKRCKPISIQKRQTHAHARATRMYSTIPSKLKFVELSPETIYTIGLTCSTVYFPSPFRSFARSFTRSVFSIYNSCVSYILRYIETFQSFLNVK